MIDRLVMRAVADTRGLKTPKGLGPTRRKMAAKLPARQNSLTCP